MSSQSEAELARVVRVTIGRRWSMGHSPPPATKPRKLQTMIDQGIDPRQEKRDRLAEAEAKRVEAEAKRDRVGAGRRSGNGSMAEVHRCSPPKWSARHLLEHER
jgi:hypothetical protein